MAFSRAKNLILDGKTLTTELENMITRLEDYILTKLERVNKALDEILPSRVHRKLVAIALRIFKFVIRTYTTVFIRAPILLIKLLLKFIFSVFWTSILKRKKSGSESESDGSRVFQLEDFIGSMTEEVNNLLDELLGSDENLLAMTGAKGKSTHHKMGILDGSLPGANPQATTLPNRPMDGRAVDKRTHDKAEISGVKLQGTNLPSTTISSASPSDPNSASNE